jgi:hypothetical protein
VIVAMGSSRHIRSCSTIWTLRRPWAAELIVRGSAIFPASALSLDTLSRPAAYVSGPDAGLSAIAWTARLGLGEDGPP